MTNDELLLGISKIIDAKLDPIKEDIRSLKADVNELKGTHTALERKFNDLMKEVISIKLFQENVLLPRLRIIEACYASTYGEYESDVEQLNALRTDVKLLQTVVRNHEDRIQNLEKLQRA